MSDRPCLRAALLIEIALGRAVVDSKARGIADAGRQRMPDQEHVTARPQARQQFGLVGRGLGEHGEAKHQREAEARDETEVETVNHVARPLC